MNKPLLISALSLLALVSCGVPPTSSGQSASSSNSDKQTSQSNSDTSKTSKSSTSKTSLPEIDHIKVFCETSFANVWAWTGNNNNLFDKWPGVKLNDYDSDWKTYDFPAGYSSINLIFSKENPKDKSEDSKDWLGWGGKISPPTFLTFLLKRDIIIKETINNGRNWI